MKKNININLIDVNNGQIPDIPQNPRYIRDEKLERLKKSIIDNPEMLELREVLVIHFNKRFVIIGGNMRFQAIKQIINIPKPEFDKIVESKKEDPDFLSWLAAITLLRDQKEVPCKVIPSDTPSHKLRSIIIKDNIGFGEDDHDLLSSEWDQGELEDFGMDLFFLDEEEEPNEEAEKQESAGEKLIFTFTKDEHKEVTEYLDQISDNREGALLTLIRGKILK